MRERERERERAGTWYAEGQSRTCLSGSIQSKHEQSHLLRSKDLAHELRDLAAHGELC